MDLNDCGKSQQRYWQTAAFWHEKMFDLIVIWKKNIPNYLTFAIQNQKKKNDRISYSNWWIIAIVSNETEMNFQKRWQMKTKRCQKINPLFNRNHFPAAKDNNFVNHFRLIDNNNNRSGICWKSVYINIYIYPATIKGNPLSKSIWYTTIQPFHLNVGLQKVHTVHTVCIFGALTDFQNENNTAKKVVWAQQYKHRKISIHLRCSSAMHMENEKYGKLFSEFGLIVF